MTKTQVGLNINGTLQYGLEKVLHDYKVDIAIWAHKHSYERMWPVFNYTVFDHSYINAKAPIHFTTGSGVSIYIIFRTFNMQICVYVFTSNWNVKYIYQPHLGYYNCIMRNNPTHGVIHKL